jgi:hypothetical protein
MRTCSSCRCRPPPGPRPRAGAGHGINAFSQGVAYYHAGIDVLRSKSLDRNSFNSGDWFNRLDWTYRDNYFGTGLPPAKTTARTGALLKPLLANAGDQAAAGRHRLRARRLPRPAGDPRQLTLFRLRSADDIKQRLRFFNTGLEQEPTVIAAHLRWLQLIPVHEGAQVGVALGAVDLQHARGLVAVVDLGGARRQQQLVGRLSWALAQRVEGVAVVVRVDVVQHRVALQRPHAAPPNNRRTAARSPGAHRPAG